MTEKKKKPYTKPKMKSELIGDASAMPPMPPPATCDGTAVLPKKIGGMGDGCKVKLT